MRTALAYCDTRILCLGTEIKCKKNTVCTQGLSPLEFIHGGSAGVVFIINVKSPHLATVISFSLSRIGNPIFNHVVRGVSMYLSLSLVLISLLAQFVPAIKNPIISGWNPDPSVLRVEDVYYIATSTFEYFPGIAIYKSRDLADWELFSHALTNSEDVQLYGVPTGAGEFLTSSKDLRWNIDSK